jgi:hypothetical protein
MTLPYARSTEVYQEMRAALGPWAKANGYRRRRGSPAGWVRPLGTERDLSFWFDVSAWGSGATGGSSFHGVLEEAPSKGSGVAPDRGNMRQRDFTQCLEQAELDELRGIQNAINARRPRTPETEAWMREDSELGEHTRKDYRQYAQGEKPYQPGDYVYFGYYSLEDVRAHTAFVARLLPEVVVRFKERWYG